MCVTASVLGKVTLPLKTLQSAEIRNLGALSEMPQFNLKG